MVVYAISDTEALRLLQNQRNQLVICKTGTQILIVDGNTFKVEPTLEVLTSGRYGTNSATE